MKNKAEIEFTSSVQPKNGRLYAVIQYKADGKKKYVWRSL